MASRLARWASAGSTGALRAPSRAPFQDPLSHASSCAGRRPSAAWAPLARALALERRSAPLARRSGSLALGPRPSSSSRRSRRKSEQPRRGGLRMWPAYARAPARSDTARMPSCRDEAGARRPRILHSSRAEGINGSPMAGPWTEEAQNSETVAVRNSIRDRRSRPRS